MKYREIVPAILCIAALIGFTLLSPRFLDGVYLLSNFTLYVEVGLLALGMTLVIVSGNIDLSVGSNLVLTAALSAKLLAAGWPTPVVLALAPAIGLTLGALNGWLIARLALPSFLVTLGTMAAYRGTAQAMLGPASVRWPDGLKGIDQQTFVFLPAPVWVLLLSAAVVGVLLHRTVWGYQIQAIGTNEPAAVFAGVRVARVKIQVFALTGLLAGIGALLMNSRLGVARHDLARGVELDAITAVVVGGTAIVGGRGTVLGTLLALVLIGLLRTGMGVANVKAEYQLTAIGILLIVAALLGNLSERSPRRPKTAVTQ